jgi:GTP pyrophosphokinase
MLHQTGLAVVMANERGALARVCSVISDLNADIVQLEFTERKPDFYRMRIDLEVRDVKHMSQIITALAAQKVVTEVERSMAADGVADVAGA